MKTATLGILLSASMVSAACFGGGGSGGGAALGPQDVERVRADARVVRARGIFERADTLLVPGAYVEGSVTAGGRTVKETQSYRGTCQGTRCSLNGETISLEDLTAGDLASPTGAALTRAEIGKRAGFDTLALEGRSQIAEKLREGSTAGTGFATSYGAWGAHGFAAVEIATGSYTEAIRGIPLEGSIRGVVAYVFGDRNPTNPAGQGSATWRGVAEAASTRTFERREGVSTLTIADLSQPRVSVGIDIGGFDISADGWADMALTNGRFASTAEGAYMAGDFHGPNHEEAYGVFDTGAYVGAFGAKRQ